jgi:two-component sensor histidine kinase
LNLHARSVRDPAALAMLVTLRSRINALALVHRILYESNNLDDVALQPFFDALAIQLRELLTASPRHIRLSIDVPPMTAPADKAVALAMLVAEAVTNAFQHAFPDRPLGNVAVRMIAGDDGVLTLTVSDDGIGARGIDPATPEGLGHSLMAGFARQLGGTLSVEVDGGTTVRVSFPDSFKAARP